MTPSAQAETINIAVAANFTAAAKDIAAHFETETGHKALLSFGSTGKLYAQIVYGAPFQLFLAADRVRPEKAETEGWAVPGTRFTYAIGKIVLYSADPTLVDDRGAILKEPEAFTKLALANPKTAPYGMAAFETMEKLGVYQDLKSKLVRGDNIAQTYQFVATRNAPLGFIALSQVIQQTEGSQWRVPEHFYTPLKQDAVLLKPGAESTAAQAFWTFLQTKQTHEILEKYGYGFEKSLATPSQ